MPVSQSQHFAPREFAAIDLGSNSFHMIVARIVNGSIQVLSRLKRRVRLADGLNEERVLSQEAIERGVNCLSLFSDRLQGFDVENVKVVGTYTLRRAVNNDEFLQQAAKVFPYPIQIISGQEEARLIYAGVSHTQPEKGRKLVIDIGGGSTEIAVGDDFSPLRVESRHMGCVSFAKRFFPEGQLTAEYFEQAYQTAIEKIEDLAWEYRELGWENVLGSSGTVKTVQKVLVAQGYRDGLITTARLKILVERCLQFTSLYNIQMKGLVEERADVLVPGLAILLALFDTFKIEAMRYSDGALREGVMYGLEQAFQVSDIRQRTAEGLAEQFNIDQQQAQRVEKTALALFEQVKNWRNHRQVSELRSILKWASLLHEIGIVINHNGIHKHSAYIIAHRDLPGFDVEQQHLLAILMRFHLKAFKCSDIRSTNRYQHRDILTLLRLFRLAVLLNRSRQAAVFPQILTLKTEKNHWQISFDLDFLTKNPLVLADLEEEQQYLAALGLYLQITSLS
ncbi:exopolyphosphatase [[Haemophilus] ducreyi]|uniref:Exopolyphosphatase n=2 Tax=Haemophilus ducreyi TaxID=730 RepID=Q7VLP4_HAEDU|nr:exopolyphosphatase [[Haemophilus] ducreyi]AAP96191.1 exopolyphosphatase [[Haemophilus] ducreyi 35000HP]AKO31152.1 exopolyphosphatase [[Haemophilus] ducreyi]AKO32599.1 exopolyphosphatase [[Haemophilus] ducreyi]AKO34049.1 exopolyphosphatase [[Haemophilus] ducreyi]AKO35495.1 exopolyphosphatase [[Haemophilus] ducreyi]